MKKLTGWRALTGLLVVLVVLPPIVRNSEWHTLNAAARSSTTGAHVRLSEGLVHYEMAGPESAPPVLLDPMASTRDPGMLQWPLVGEYLFRVAVLPGMAAGQSRDFAHPERFPEWADRYREQMRYLGFGRALLSTLRHVITRDPMPTYQAVGAQRRPVLLIWGEQDQTTPYALNTQVRQALGEHQFLSVADAGHLPHLERPEVVEPALLAFLASP